MVTKFSHSRFNRFFLQLFCLAAGLGSLAFTFAGTGSPAYNDNDTLAVIGKKIITTADFTRLYKEKLMKVGFTDNVEARSKYLLNLVSDEVLIAEAKARGMDKTSLSQKELKRIKLQELLNAYSIKHISPSVVVTENDLEELFVRLNTKIKVSHLYAPDKEKADSLYNELMDGKKFEELAKENFLDPVLKNNGGSLGYISVDDMDPAFEKAAYSMKPGEISKPVKTVEGYSIIRVEDIKANPLVTENEFLKAHDRLRGFAQKRAFEEASKEYTESLNKKLNVKFNKKLVSEIFNAVHQEPVGLLSEKPAGIPASDLKKIVLTTSRGDWTLITLIEELSLVSDKQKKFIRTCENLEDLISGIVNRKYISQKALEENLDKDPAFNKNVSYTFDTYILAALEEELRKQIVISPDSVKSYYENNLKLFTSEPEMRLSSILLNNSSSADSVKIALQNGVQFEELAQKFSIQTYTAALGGDMGFFKKSELENLSDQIFALKPGEYTGPFIDNGEYVFIKCTDYKRPELKPFQEVSGDIEHNLRGIQWLSTRDKYVESAKKGFKCLLFTQKLTGLKL